jgi:hypothetical protein
VMQLFRLKSNAELIRFAIEQRVTVGTQHQH